MDPALLEALLAMFGTEATIAPPERGDVLGLRAMIDEAMAAMTEQFGHWPDVRSRVFSVPVEGAEIEARWYSREGCSPGSAVLYLHGGGLIAGTLDNYESRISRYVSLSGVPFLAIAYRLAPEHSGTGPAEDSFAALRWLRSHAPELGVDSRRIAVMGDSGGGAVAAGTAILAREHAVAVAKQLLIYPMLDDRTVEPDPTLAEFAIWSYEQNRTAWDAMLGEARGSSEVPAIAAPGRLTDFRGLPPAYVDVGELDIYRDESISFARGLLAAGISCELHVHPGTPHAPEEVAPQADVCRRMLADRIRALTSF